jgi:hypothetical protein
MPNGVKRSLTPFVVLPDALSAAPVEGTRLRHPCRYCFFGCSVAGAAGAGALAAGCSLPAAGAGALAAGCSLLVAGAGAVAAGCSVLAADAGALAAGCSVLAAGAGAVAAGCSVLAAGAGAVAAGCSVLAAGAGELVLWFDDDCSDLPQAASNRSAALKPATPVIRCFLVARIR